MQTLTLNLKNMHCASCAMNIDGALEDTPGVLSASTSFAKQKVEVKFDEEKISLEKIISVIKESGYDVAGE